jgi:hypothetical protein
MAETGKVIIPVLSYINTNYAVKAYEGVDLYRTTLEFGTSWR